MRPYIVQNENALFYECGFSCDNAIFIRLNETEAFFLTDARYTTEASELVKNAVVIDGQRDLANTARSILRKSGVKSLLFDPQDFSVAKFNKLTRNLNVKFQPQINLSFKKREIKTPAEIDIIKEAAELGKRSFDNFCVFIKEQGGIGMSEERLFYHAELIFKNQGKTALSFSPIVAFNENAAKPHALPSSKVLSQSDLLLLDAGVKHKRYCSDRTRTAQISNDFNFSKAQRFKDSFRQKVYDTVLKAQEAAIKTVAVGVRASDIDFAARSVIDEAGFGKYFIHSTGHGVGLDIHELPVISSHSDTIIQEGMVFTIEPGIYLAGEFGVRIEDMVAVRNGKALVL